jgi:esterase/lipase superfamily enzyme
MQFRNFRKPSSGDLLQSIRQPLTFTCGRRRKLLRSVLLIPIAICGLLQVNVQARQTPQAPVFQADFQVCGTEVTPVEERRLLNEKMKYEKSIKSRRSTEKSSTTVSNELRSTQAGLLQVLERLECKHLSELSDPVVRGSSLPKPNFIELNVDYATDRLPNPGTTKTRNPSQYFSGTLDPDFKDFSFGTVRVTIPTNRNSGELNLPRFWNFVNQSDPEHFFVIQQITEVDRARFMQMINTPGANEESSLLLFVHGFDTTFTDAAFRAAQLAHDLQFRGKIMFYSWPSAGVITGYWKDEDSSRISTLRFQKLLADLLATKITHIYIVSHSMGSRIVIPAVNSLASRGDVSKVSELLLAAPDFNEIEFKDLAAGFRELRAKGTRLTIYASSNDFALRASKVVHSYRRLGESDPALDVFNGLDSVDASTVAPLRRSFGHSYVYDCV